MLEDANRWIIDNFLDASEYVDLFKHISAAPLRYGAKSNAEDDPFGHLSWKPYFDKRQNLSDLTTQVLSVGGSIAATWRKLKATLEEHGQGFKLIRCYVNAYTYGMDGYFHTDSNRDDELTAILYICENWQPNWAGETVLLDDHGEIAIATLPRPNRMMIINSNTKHAARAVSRMCREQRTVLVFKCRPARDAGFEKLSNFLTTFGARDLEHQNGTLHDHLVRVYHELHLRQHDPEVCFGGGLHSVYGTNAYAKQLLRPNAAERSMVAGQFGERAEALAYLFSTLNRPETLENPVKNKVETWLLRLRYDQSVEVDHKLLYQLRLIECANLADQGSLYKQPTLRAMWRDGVPSA